MPEENSSAPRRAAEWLLQRALRFWPHESGKWGRALAAELPSVENPWDAFRWAMGGLMLLIREWLRHALGSWKRPIGVPAGGPLESQWQNAPRVPRTPRIVTAMLLLACVGMLLVPEVREALGSVVGAWRNFASERYLPIQPAIEHLRKEASRTQDPQLLALTALLSEDSKERFALADTAVRLDPSLTWISFELHHDTTTDEDARLEAVKRLQKWDPDNAVAWLASADLTFDQVRDAWIKAGHGYDVSRAQQQLEQNPAWMASMDRAFDAPRYDAYSGRVFDLYRTVAERHKVREPEIVLDLLITSAIPNLQALRMYSTAQFDRAAIAERAGNRAEAARLCWRVAVFGEEMRGSGHTEIERLIGVVLQKDSYEKLQPLLNTAANADEVSLIRHELQTMEASVNQLRYDDPGARGLWFGRKWTSLVLHALAVFGLLLAVAMAFAFGFFVFKQRNVEAKGGGASLSCLIIDYGPVLLVLTLAALAATYYPVARTYDLYLSAQGGISDFRGLVDSLTVPYAVEELLSGGGIDVASQFWLATTGVLFLIAVYILFRGKLGRREAEKQA